MSSRLEEIRAANGEVFGISVDSPFSQAKWAELEGFDNVPMLSDMGREAAQAYGCLYDELLGLKGVSKRAAFVINPEGTIIHQEIMENAGELPDLEAAFSKVMEG